MDEEQRPDVSLVCVEIGEHLSRRLACCFLPKGVSRRCVVDFDKIEALRPLAGRRRPADRLSASVAVELSEGQSERRRSARYVPMGDGFGPLLLPLRARRIDFDQRVKVDVGKYPCVSFSQPSIPFGVNLFQQIAISVVAR